MVQVFGNAGVPRWGGGTGFDWEYEPALRPAHTTQQLCGSGRLRVCGLQLCVA